MKIECNKEKLYEAVMRVEKTTNKNTPLPVLSCVLLVASEKGLLIKATNLEVGVEILVPVTKLHQDGILAVPAQTFQQILSSIKANKNILLSQDGGNLLIEGDSTKTSLKTISYDEFPLIPRIEESSQKFPLKTKDFLLGVKSVIWSASISTIKPEQGSVYIYQKNGNLIFVATDSFRLAEKRIPFKSENQFPSVLIPYKNCAEVIRIVDNLSEEMSISVTKNQINIILPTIFISCRLVDGNFPDYEQVIPKEPRTVATSIKQEVVDALKTLNVLSDKFNQVTFVVDKNSNSMTLETKNSDLGEGRGIIKTKVTGEDITINFNQKYIQDSFQAISDDGIALSFGGPHKPLLIEGSSNKNFRYLVMPMNR